MPTQRALLIVGSIIFSAGVTPIFIRYTQDAGMPSLVIIFIRLWLVVVGILPFVLRNHRPELTSLTRRQIILSGIAGFWLAINLFMLFFALEYTSVLVTSVLRRTTPLWIAFPEVILLGAVFTRRFWASLVISIVGVVLITVGGVGAIEAGSDPLLGAGMATFGAVCFGIYLLIGRTLSDAIPTVLYSWLVFIGAAITTSAFMLGTQTPVLGYPIEGYLLTIVVTFMANVLGHMVINLGLQYFSATAMAIILQVGVVVSAVIAIFTFGEIPTWLQLLGSAMVIVGVLVVTLEQNDSKAKPKRSASVGN